MTDAEKAAVKKFAHQFSDEFLPAIIAAEEAKLPDAYKSIVQSILGALMPAVTGKLDEYIESKLA